MPSSLQAELWVDAPSAAIAFYRAAFGAEVAFSVGEGDDIVAQLTVGDGAFWVGATSEPMGRLSPEHAGGATGRMLLIVDDPDMICLQAITAGAAIRSEVADEHGWRIGRVVDPSGHEWEIGRPLANWPPSHT